jgi:hypothetical protein
MSNAARKIATAAVEQLVDADTSARMEQIEDESAASAPAEMPYIQVTLGDVAELMPSRSITKALLGDEAKQNLFDQATGFWANAVAMNPQGSRALANEYQGRVIVSPMGRVVQGMARTFLTQAYYSAGTARRAHEAFVVLQDVLHARRESNPMPIDGDPNLGELERSAEKVARAALDACTWMAMAHVFVTRASSQTDGEPITGRVRNPKVKRERVGEAKPTRSTAAALVAAGGWTEEPTEEEVAEVIGQEVLAGAVATEAAAREAEERAAQAARDAEAREARKAEARAIREEREAEKAKALAARKLAAAAVFAAAEGVQDSVA